jgi:hypothetical protein
MDDTPYLRRQAALCLNLSQSCSDAQMAEHLNLMAAEFHAQALKAEFKATFDPDLSADPFGETDIENLRLLLNSSKIADMFDETSRQRIGELSAESRHGANLASLHAESSLVATSHCDRQGPQPVRARTPTDATSLSQQQNRHEGPMSDEEQKAELERLRSEDKALKKGSSSSIRMKVSEKGALSIYGMGRFPVTLYKEQWLKLLEMSADIRAFIAANEAQLKTKGSS